MATGRQSDESADDRTLATDQEHQREDWRPEPPDKPGDEHLEIVDRISERHDRVDKAQSLYDRLKLVLLVLIVLLVSAMLVITTITLQELRENSARNRLNTTLLVDCTTPQGKCYRESNSRTANVVTDLNRVTVLAAYCAKRLPAGGTLDQMRDCIKTELDKERP